MCAYIHGVAGSAAAIWSWGEQRVTSPLLVAAPPPFTFLSCPVSTSVRHPMACWRVPAPPTLLIHVGSRRSATHIMSTVLWLLSCEPLCLLLTLYTVCCQIKVVGSWRLLVLEKKITRRPDVSYRTFTIFEDFSSVSAGQMEDAHGAERGNGRRDRWPNNVLCPLPPSLPPFLIVPSLFLYNLLSAFSKICTWSLLSVSEVLHVGWPICLR